MKAYAVYNRHGDILLESIRLSAKGAWDTMWGDMEYLKKEHGYSCKHIKVAPVHPDRVTVKRVDLQKARIFLDKDTYSDTEKARVIIIGMTSSRLE